MVRQTAGLLGCDGCADASMVDHATDSRGAHLTLRAGGEKKTVPLPSVQQVQPYLPVLSTFSTAGKAKPLPSRTFCYVLTAAEHADKLQRRL